MSLIESQKLTLTQEVIEAIKKLGGKFYATASAGINLDSNQLDTPTIEKGVILKFPTDTTEYTIANVQQFQVETNESGNVLKLDSNVVPKPVKSEDTVLNSDAKDKAAVYKDISNKVIDKSIAEGISNVLAKKKDAEETTKAAELAQTEADAAKALYDDAQKKANADTSNDTLTNAAAELKKKYEEKARVAEEAKKVADDTANKLKDLSNVSKGGANVVCAKCARKTRRRQKRNGGRRRRKSSKRV